MERANHDVDSLKYSVSKSQKSHWTKVKLARVQLQLVPFAYIYVSFFFYFIVLRSLFISSWIIRLCRDHSAEQIQWKRLIPVVKNRFFFSTWFRLSENVNVKQLLNHTKFSENVIFVSVIFVPALELRDCFLHFPSTWPFISRNKYNYVIFQKNAGFFFTIVVGIVHCCQILITVSQQQKQKYVNTQMVNEIVFLPVNG